MLNNSMVEDKFTNIVVNNSASKASIDTNDAATSVGITESDGIDYTIPTNEYNITSVYEDVILAEFVTSDNTDKNGMKQSSGGILYKEEKEESMYKVVKAIMVGPDAANTEVGDLLLVSETSGIKVVPFDGIECVMLKEINVFMKLEKKV